MLGSMRRAETYPSNWIIGDSEILVRMFWRLVGAIILRISSAKERPSEKGPMHLLGWWGRSSGPILNSWISSSISMNHSTVQYITALPNGPSTKYHFILTSNSSAINAASLVLELSPTTITCIQTIHPAGMGLMRDTS